MTETAEQNKDLNSRTIVLIYGLLEDGGPFWLYAAVKPSKYQEFLNTYKNGTLNLYAFEEFGEVIISGKGKAPPDEVTVKVAALYQTDPALLRTQTDALDDIESDKK